MASQYIRYIEIIIYCLLTATLIFAIYYVYHTTNNIIPSKNLPSRRNNFINSVDAEARKMPDNILDYIDSAKNIGDFKTINIDTTYLTEDEQIAMTKCKDIKNDEDTVKKITNLPALFPYAAAKYSSSSNISCSAIYSEFLLNNKDFDAKVLQITGENKSLNDLCPITVKTPEYINCLDTVENILKKTNAIVSDVSNNIDDALNKNIDNSFNKLTNIEDDLLTVQMQKKYQDYMLYSGGASNNTSINTSNISDASILAGVNKYYSTKAIEGFNNMDDELQKGIIVMDNEQTKYFSGNFILTKSFNLLDNITIEIKNNIIIFYDNVSKTPLFFYEYDNVKTVGVLNNNMSVSSISAGELQAVKVRITKLIQNNSGNSMENAELLTLLNNIGFTAPGFIYIVRTDIDVLDGNKRIKKEYYLVKNSGYATMFQMFRAV